MQQPDAFARADYVPSEPDAPEIPRDSDAAELAPLDEDLAPAETEEEDGILGIGTPEHGWVGKAFVGSLGALGVVSTGRVLYRVLTDLGGFTLWETLGTLPMMLFHGVLSMWVAWKIHNFRLVGLGLAFIFLLLSLYAAITRLLAARDVVEIMLCFLVAGLSILWLGYLWTRRSDFS